MSNSFSIELETRLLNHVFVAGQGYAPPTTILLALYTTAPSQFGPGTEVSGGGYTRMPATFPLAGSQPPSTATNLDIQFPTATAAWGTIVAGALWDNFVFLASAMCVDPSDMVTPLPRPILPGDVFRVPAGNLQVGFAAPASASGFARSVMRPIGAEVTRPGARP
jgi:hypothetical protein